MQSVLMVPKNTRYCMDYNSVFSENEWGSTGQMFKKLILSGPLLSIEVSN